MAKVCPFHGHQSSIHCSSKIFDCGNVENLSPLKQKRVQWNLIFRNIILSKEFFHSKWLILGEIFTFPLETPYIYVSV